MHSNDSGVGFFRRPYLERISTAYESDYKPAGERGALVLSAFLRLATPYDILSLPTTGGTFAGGGALANLPADPHLYRRIHRSILLAEKFFALYEEGTVAGADLSVMKVIAAVEKFRTYLKEVVDEQDCLGLGIETDWERKKREEVERRESLERRKRELRLNMAKGKGVKGMGVMGGKGKFGGGGRPMLYFPETEGEEAEVGEQGGFFGGLGGFFGGEEEGVVEEDVEAPVAEGEEAAAAEGGAVPVSSQPAAKAKGAPSSTAPDDIVLPSSQRSSRPPEESLLDASPPAAAKPNIDDTYLDGVRWSEQTSWCVPLEVKQSIFVRDSLQISSRQDMYDLLQVGAVLMRCGDGAGHAKEQHERQSMERRRKESKESLGAAAMTEDEEERFAKREQELDRSAAGAADHGLEDAVMKRLREREANLSNRFIVWKRDLDLIKANSPGEVSMATVLSVRTLIELLLQQHGEHASTAAALQPTITAAGTADAIEAGFATFDDHPLTASPAMLVAMLQATQVAEFFRKIAEFQQAARFKVAFADDEMLREIAVRNNPEDRLRALRYAEARHPKKQVQQMISALSNDSILGREQAGVSASDRFQTSVLSDLRSPCHRVMSDAQSCRICGVSTCRICGVSLRMPTVLTEQFMKTNLKVWSDVGREAAR